jgi:hypothetical protein
MKSASPAKLSRKPIEFLCEVEMSEVVEVVLTVLGLEAAVVIVSIDLY